MMNAASTSNPSVTVNVGEAYPYPSHAFGPNFVTMKLSGKDTYSVWETQILSLLWSQHMVGFIEDQFPSPEGNGKGKVGDIDAWIASDSLVKGWILGSLSDGVAKKVVNRLKTIHKNTYFTAKDLWDQLQRSYGPSNCKQAEDSLVKGWILGSLSEEARKAVNHLIHMEKDPDFTAKDLWDELQRSYGPSVHEQAVETKSPTRQAESEIEEISESEDAKSKEKPTEEKTEEEKRAETFQKEFETKFSTRQEESVIEMNSMSEYAKSKDEPQKKKMSEMDMRLLYRCVIEGYTGLLIDQLKEYSLNPWDKLTNNGNTVLHIAVGSQNHKILKKLLEMTQKENTLLDLVNSDGSTLLHVAAIGGNMEVVDMLVERNPELLLAKDKEGHTPLALSVSNMHTKTSQCLFEHMKVHGYDNLFSGQSGEDLVVLAISCQDFRLAKMIINEYPDAIISDSDAVLTTLAQNFPRELNFWERRDFMEEVENRTDPYSHWLEERVVDYYNWTLWSCLLATLLFLSIYGFYAIVTAFLLFLKAIGKEHFDVLTKTGQKTGLTKPRGAVHRDGDYHRAVHVWIFAESTQQLLLQKRTDCKDSWPGLWDISSAGHVSAGDASLISARRELQEELGLTLPADAFELLFVFLQQSVTNNGNFINNEFDDVYLVTTIDPIPLEAFTLQESEVSSVKYISVEEYKQALARKDPKYVPNDVDGQYGQLFDIIIRRYQGTVEARSLDIQKKLNRYAPVSLSAELTGLTEEDKEALVLLIHAARMMDDIFHQQVWCSNPSLREWLKGRSHMSEYDKLKWSYYSINKSPWSSLDENEAFLTTADSAVRLLPEATKPIVGWKGLEYKVAFLMQKPPGANFYPPDMDKMEFELWTKELSGDEKQGAAGFFNVIRRHCDSHSNRRATSASDLCSIPYSQEYSLVLAKAAELLHKAGNLTSSPSLKRLLHSKADAFLSNDYYESDIAWMELDSKVDVTIGPYETYEDVLFGYKATFEAFIGVRDDKATSQVKLFGDHLQVLEQNLPMGTIYKSSEVIAAPIRVVQLVYNSGDVKGPQTVAFNLPNDERIVKDRGTSMVMLKNVSEAKFKLILQPIADVCIIKEQRELVDFDSFFTHTICHECCHGIGPHTITLPSGQKSTVRLELQELHSALEEAKADIVCLWALKFLIDKGLLPKSLVKSMYVSFLAGCFRSVRFGLEEAHGKGQALQFNWLFEKGGFVLHHDETFSVNFDKIEGAVESLSRVVLTTQAKGDKDAAQELLAKYCVMTKPLKIALAKLEMVQVPVDIAPEFPVVYKLLQEK